MGDFPPGRVAARDKAFSHTGIEYYGPFTITTRYRNKHKKVRGVIFTSMTACAVHLDLVTGLSMDKCMQAIELFLTVYGDANGSNFRDVENVLYKICIVL